MESNKEPEITGGKKRIGIVVAIAAAVCIVAVAVIFIVTGGTERRQAESDKTGGTSVSAEDAAAEENASVGEEAPEEEDAPVRVPYAEEMAVIADAAVGDIVTFGSYEQDNDLENGMEPVEWYVLDKEDGEATLMSVYLLDWQSYNEDFIDMTWEDCTLRSW